MNKADAMRALLFEKVGLMIQNQPIQIVLRTRVEAAGFEMGVKKAQPNAIVEPGMLGKWWVLSICMPKHEDEEVIWKRFNGMGELRKELGLMTAWKKG